MAKLTYDRWRVDVKDGKAEKLKLVKAGIRISEEHAEVLNHGALTGFSVAPEMYFLAEVEEEKEEVKKAPIKGKKLKEAAE